MRARVLAVAVAGLLAVSGECRAQASTNDTAIQAPFDAPVMTRLGDAACIGDRNAVRRSLENGADVNGEGEAGITPLLWALRCRSVEGVRVLLDAGADPDKVVNGIPTLIFATRLEDVQFLSAFLDHGADPNASYEAVFATPLDVALLHGINGRGWAHWDLLLRSGVNVNLPDHSGQTTAMKAARATAYDRVIELLEHGYNYDLPALRGVLTSRIGSARGQQNPSRLRLISMLDQSSGD